MCKSTLGLKKHASDLMSKSELGRYPLFAIISKNIYTYWQHILQAAGSLLGLSRLQWAKTEHFRWLYDEVDDT